MLSAVASASAPDGAGAQDSFWAPTVRLAPDFTHRRIDISHVELNDNTGVDMGFYASCFSFYFLQTVQAIIAL